MPVVWAHGPEREKQIFEVSSSPRSGLSGPRSLGKEQKEAEVTSQDLTRSQGAKQPYNIIIHYV